MQIYQRENKDKAAHAGSRRKIIDNKTLDLIVMLSEAITMTTLREIKEEAMDILPTKTTLQCGNAFTLFGGRADITEDVP